MTLVGKAAEECDLLERQIVPSQMPARPAHICKFQSVDGMEPEPHFICRNLEGFTGCKAMRQIPNTLEVLLHSLG